MSLAGVRTWARRRTPLEWAVLLAGVAVFGGVGWDAALWEPRIQLLLHVLGAGVAIGLVVTAWRRTTDLPLTRIDPFVLLLVACFALATVSALNVGMSLRALASIIGFAVMLPAALLAIRHHPSWVGAIAGVSVLVLSAPTLLVLLARRAEWFLAGGPGLPPLRLGAEGTPFGSIAVPPFVIWPAWALAGLISDPWWRRVVRTGLVVVGVPLTILSGSRSAWLAIGVTLAVAGAPWLWRQRGALRERMRLTPAGVLLALGLLAVTALVATVVVPRLLAVTSLLYRLSLWRDTLTAWSTDPLLGIGPGFMPIARQAAAPDFSFPVRQPHSHNLPLGVLGDAGLLGLAAGIALVVALAWVAGPWRSRTRVGRQAAFVLLGVGVGGLFEDLTFEPNVNLLVIGLVAVALADAGAVRWTRFSSIGWRRHVAVAMSAAAGAVLLAATVTADAGAIAYRAGVERALEGRWAAAADWFRRSEEIDPWHPAAPKALTVAAERAGDPVAARDAARRATALHPGDAPSWTNLALLCEALGDRDCAREAATRATATAGFGGLDQLNAAHVLDGIGETAAADEAYRRSLLSQRLTAFGDPWPRPVSVRDEPPAEEVGDLMDLNRVLAWWAVGDPIEPGTLEDPSARALAHAALGERDEAETWIRRAVAERPEESITWLVATVLYDHWGNEAAAAEHRRIGEAVSGARYPDRDAEPEVRALTYDLSTFRTYPRDELVGSARRILLEPPMPWALERILP